MEIPRISSYQTSKQYIIHYLCGVSKISATIKDLRMSSEVNSLRRVRLCDPKDCSLPGSSIPGILQARVLERVAISFSRRSSQPRDRTRVSYIAGRLFTYYRLDGFSEECQEQPKSNLFCIRPGHRLMIHG